MVEVIGTTPTQKDLEILYDVCNEIFKNDELFYSSNEVKELKKDNDNIFIK